jgi:SAM-dependent methyltransferase
MAALALGARAVLPHLGVESHSFAMLLAAGAVPVAITALQWPHARRFGLMLGMVLLCAPDMFPMNVLNARRNFFGVLRVAESGDGKVMQFFHGSTLHGGEWRDPSRRREPLEYYGRVGPVGQVFETMGRRLSGAGVAVVGLGMGGLAAYAQPGQRWEFIEIDPDVAAIAADTRYFHFLADAPTPIRVVLDDGRLALARAEPGSFALIVMDAFSSDSVPVHLITTDALAVYRRALRRDGLLLINVSNRYLDLAPIAGTVGVAAGFHGCTRFHDVSEKERLAGLVPSTWVALATDGELVAALAAQPGWRPLDRSNQPAWTDDFADVFGAIMWRR